MSDAVAYTATIPEAIDTRPALNFDSMLAEGIEEIERLSRNHWTNYNSSDPGITMLEMLCYSLLNLGYQSGMPVKDLLTGANGKIQTKERFYTAAEILFTNPITENDFRRLILDRVTSVKNVWFKQKGDKGSTFEVYYEVKDWIKERWLRTILNQQPPPVGPIPVSGLPEALQSLDEVKEDLRNVSRAIDQYLLSHRNLGQVFYPAEEETLQYAALSDLLKSIDIQPSARVEDTLAMVYQVVNHFFSPGWDFQTYKELLAEDMTTEEIMQGPSMSHGYLVNFEDSHSDQKLMKLWAVLNELPGIISISPQSNLTHFSTHHGDKRTDRIAYFSPQVKSSNSNTHLTISHDGRGPITINLARLCEKYNALVVNQTLATGLSPSELGPELPQGEFRDVADYQSIQEKFPAFFGLRNQLDQSVVAPAHQAKIKQLKAYLMLFEQLIANHQAQVADLGSLLGFHTDKRRFINTYHYQGLYNVPGAEGIIKDFENYLNENHATQADPALNWSEYKVEPNNGYMSKLAHIQASRDEQIEHKDDLLRHQLARYGEQFDVGGIIYLNPGYGNFNLARAEAIQTILENTELVSANIGRSYFHTNPRKVLLSGLELKLGQTIQLNAYYQAIVGILDKKELTLHGEKVVDFKKRKPQHKDLRNVLTDLIRQTEGFVLIDNAMLKLGITPQEPLTLKSKKSISLVLPAELVICNSPTLWERLFKICLSEAPLNCTFEIRLPNHVQMKSLLEQRIKWLQALRQLQGQVKASLKKPEHSKITETTVEVHCLNDDQRKADYEKAKDNLKKAAEAICVIMNKTTAVYES